MSVIDTVLATVLERSRRKLIMASFKANALMAWMFASNRVEIEDGGYNITNPLILGRNPNITPYEYYEPYMVGQTSEFGKAEYRWSRFAGTMIVSGQEEDEAKGAAAIVKLAKAKMDVLEESIKEQFSIWLYGAGAGNTILGLSALIPDDPTTGILGGINRATESQWRTSSYQFSGAIDSTNIEEVLDDLLLDLSPKNERPTVFICGRNIIRTYRAAVRNKVVINLSETNSGKKMMDLGFKGVTHQGVTMLYDEDCPVDRMYAINDKYLKLHILKGVNMRVDRLGAPWDIDARGSRVVWQGQMCLWRAFRTHAVINNAA